MSGDTASNRSSIVCACGNHLGRWLGPPEHRIARMVRHDRVMVAVVISITCEKCGELYSPPIPAATGQYETKVAV